MKIQLDYMHVHARKCNLRVIFSPHVFVLFSVIHGHSHSLALTTWLQDKLMLQSRTCNTELKTTSKVTPHPEAKVPSIHQENIGICSHRPGHHVCRASLTAIHKINIGKKT